MEITCKCLGMLTGGKWDRMNESIRRVYDPDFISPTITTCGGGNQEVKIIDPKNRLEPMCVRQVGRDPENPTARKVGAPTQQMVEPYQEDGCVGSLTTVQKDNMVLEPSIRIRKLTALECWRLMGFSDLDFLTAKTGSVEISKEILAKYPHEGKRRMTEAERLSRMSNTQLYKQAGNSIVVNVLMAIFGQMLDGKERVYDGYTDRISRP